MAISQKIKKILRIDVTCPGLYFFLDMQVSEDVMLFKTHMHNTKTNPCRSCKELRDGGAYLALAAKKGKRKTRNKKISVQR